MYKRNQEATSELLKNNRAYARGIAWLSLYEQKPLTTIIFTSLSFIGFLASIYLIDQGRKITIEKERLEDISYLKKIEQLNSTESNLKEILEFVKTQKVQLQQSKDTLNSIKEERKKLKPILEAEQEVVVAILDAQEKRQQTKVWHERGIGFVVGMASSIAATIICNAFISWKRSQSAKEAEQKSFSGYNN